MNMPCNIILFHVKEYFNDMAQIFYLHKKNNPKNHVGLVVRAHVFTFTHSCVHKLTLLVETLVH